MLNNIIINPIMKYTPTLLLFNLIELGNNSYNDICIIIPAIIDNIIPMNKSLIKFLKKKYANKPVVVWKEEE